MLGELTNIPTDTLIDMLYIILAGEVAINASGAAEIEQIQRELQRRDGAQSWSFGPLTEKSRLVPAATNHRNSVHASA